MVICKILKLPLYFLIINPILLSLSLETNQCSEKCGNIQIPFPFYLNSTYSCGGWSLKVVSDAFHLSCSSLVLYLNIGSQSYKVIQFLTNGVLVDYFPNTSSSSTTSCTTPHTDFENFEFKGNDYFGILNDSAIEIKCGVTLEWAIPRNSSMAKCSFGAYTINATSFPSGIRCRCPNGLDGDGFAYGLGCFKTCLKDGRETFGKDCKSGRSHHAKKVKVLVGVFASALSLALLATIFFLAKRTTKKSSVISDKDHHTEGANISSRNSSKTRLFSYDELKQATNGFNDSQKLVEGTESELYAGVLGDGSQVAIHKFKKIEENESVSKSYEVLSAVPHTNLAHVLGCCIDTSLHVVYDYPNYGTLEKHLLRRRDNESNLSEKGLNWCMRLKVASETASLLAFLRDKISPPFIHQDLNPGFIFLDSDFSPKIAGFIPSDCDLPDEEINKKNYTEGQFCTRDNVYSMGLLLVDLISGVGERHLPPTIILEKIKSGKIEEIVDPFIYYEDHREAINFVADLATRCLLFGSKFGMITVARELTHILNSYGSGTKLGFIDSNSSNTSSSSRTGQTELEETFSNSSLLQMISMSPDSIWAPH